MTQIDISPLEGQRSGWSFHVYVDGLRHDYGPYLARDKAEADREDLLKQRALHKGPRPHAGQSQHSVVRTAEPIDFRRRLQRTATEESIMANAPSKRGRNQDRARVAGGQDHEVKDGAKKAGASKVEVKKTVKTVGISYERVEK
jgi:hypothetical protein